MTILDSELTSLDGLDKGYHALYTQKDGKWLLTGVKNYDPGAIAKLQGVADKERANASKHANELKPWKTLFGDKKPEDIQAQLDKTEEYKLASKGKLDETELEARVAARLVSATKPFERKVTEATEKAAKAEARIKEYETAEETALIVAAIQEAALATSALPKTYAKGGALLAVLQGQLQVEVSVDAEGKRTLGKVTTKDGKDVADAIKAAQTTHDYCWAPSKGTGSRSPTGFGAGGKNPFAKETANRTAQMEMISQQPELAKQMAAAAGVSLTI